MESRIEEQVEEMRKKLTDWEFKKWLEYQFGDGKLSEEGK